MTAAAFAAFLVATLAGGLLGSFGLNLLLQRTGFARIIQRWRWWGLTLFYAAVLVTVAGGLIAIVRRIVRPGADSPVLESPGLFFLFGLLGGLPFTLPTVTSIWRDRHGGRRAAKRGPSTQEDRLAFARDLERQIRELGDESRSATIELRGDTGDILVLGGAFTRLQGERFVAALRRDFEDVGIRRVEGSEGGHRWWVPVVQETKKPRNKK